LVRGGYSTELKKIKDILDLFKNAYPTSEAIRQATGGNQTLKILKDAIIAFLEDATGSHEYIKEMVS